jgi:microcystin-dependent protein
MDPIIGSILLVPFNFAPRGWLICDGQLMSIAQNAALFSLVGTQFGGDGRNTFALPKLVAPMQNMYYVIATEGVYPSRP